MKFASNIVVAGALVFAAVGAAPLPWYAQPTTAVSVRHVEFSNGDAVLSGTLYLPAATGRVPAIVVLHGASEPLASTPLYDHLRDGLPQIGVAVLVFDRRGSGASTGKADVAYQTLADDGIAGANAIRALPQIDAQRVGYWGISQGGWLATWAASRDPRAAFAVAVSAPLVPAEAQMEFAMSNRLEVLGYGASDIADMMNARRKIDGYFSGANSRDEAVAAIEKIENRPWFDQMYLPKAASLPADPAKSTWRQQMDIDFFANVERVTIPILFVLGSSDPWIPVAETVTRLHQVAATHPLLQYAVIPAANHLMMTPPVPERMSDADPKEVALEKPDSAAYFLVLGSWLTRVAISPAASPAARPRR